MSRGASLLAAFVALAALGIGPALVDRARAADAAWRGRPEEAQRCRWAASTGQVCPACGGTRGFALVAQGRPLEAWRANPGGALVGLQAWMVVVAGLSASVSDRGAILRAALTRVVAPSLVALGLAAAAWWLSLPPPLRQL